MIKKIKKFCIERPDLLCNLALVFLGLHVFLGLKGGLLYIGGDTGIPLNPLRDFDLLYLWQNQEGGVVGLNLGIIFQLIFFATFKYLGLDSASAQHFYIYFAHTTAGLGMYYLVNSFLLKQKRLTALIASIVYMFSPWLFNYLGIFVFLPYSVMPFILAVFVRGIKGKMSNVKAIVLINFLLFGVIINFPQYSMVFVAMLLMFLYFLFYVLVDRGRFWPALKFSLILVIITFLGSLWFILPYWHVFSSMGIGGELESTVLISSAIHNFGDYGFSTILHLLRMLGAAGFMTGGATYSEPYLNNSFLIMLGFLVPILVFSALIFRLKSKVVLFFALIAVVFIFIAKGVNPPFGNFHFWLVSNFPVARALRTTWNLSLGANIAYAFLIGVGIIEIANRLSPPKTRGIIFAVLGLLALFLINSWPLLNGAYFQIKSNPPSFEGVKIPLAYYDLESYLASDLTDSRFFRIPDSKGMIRTNWGYSGSDFSPVLFSTPIVSGHPLAKSSADLLKGLYERIKNKSQLEPEAIKLLSLLNVRRIVFDGYDDSSKFKIEKPISSQFGVVPQKKIGRFEIYQLKDEDFLPHFYLAERAVYTNVAAQDFLDVIDFPEYSLRSGILPFKSKSLIKPEGMEEESIVVTIPLVSLETEDRKQRILDRMEEESKGTFFPYARWRPGGIIYYLVLEKERLSLRASGQRPEEVIDKDLLFAAKRIVELSRWGTILNDEQWKQISDLYRQSMEDVFIELEKIYQGGNIDAFIGNLSKAQVSLLAHKIKLEEALFLKGGYFERSQTMDESFDNLKERFKAINELPDLLNPVYSLEIPHDGFYRLDLKENKDYFREMSEALMGLEVDNQKLLPGELRFYQQGKHRLSLSFKEGKNLLTEDKWNHGPDPLLEENQGLVSFHFFPLPPGEESSIVHQEVLDYIPEAYYQLSFDYFAKNKQAGIAVIQDTDVDEKRKEVNPRVSRQLEDSLGEFRHFRTVFKSTPNSSQANIYLLARQEKGETNSVKFKNVRLERVFGPKVILRTPLSPNLEVNEKSPEIIFTKINPTKYKVRVESATSPYLLIFSESFHPNWKVYLSGSLSSDRGDVDILASYLSGLVKEGKHRGSFLARDTFETWGKKTIVSDRHFLVNGYANAWQIFPDDVGGKDGYELIIEFESQKYFYIGFFISLFVFLVCFGWLFLKTIRRKE